MTTQARGTLYAAFDNNNLSLAFARDDKAQVVALDYESPCRDDINAQLLGIAQTIMPNLNAVCEIVVFEDEPDSRDAAQRQNLTKRAIATISHARGFQLRAIHGVHAEALLVATLSIDAPESAYELPKQVNALQLAAWDRTAKEYAVSFGKVVRRGDLRRARSLVGFDELIGGAFRGRWRWHGFDAALSAKGGPVWLKAEGVA